MVGHSGMLEPTIKAIEAVDTCLGKVVDAILAKGGAAIITADHGCDPLTESTDHSREYTPLLVYRKGITPKNLGTRESFSDIGKTICACLSVENELVGKDFSGDIYD